MENEKRNEKKLNNKGFSLVELIIVMAIMAILVGVVGTQVIPYMNQARESKDYQIVSSYATAAMTAYTINAESSKTTTIEVYKKTYENTGEEFEKAVQSKIKELTYDDVKTAAWSSEKGKKIEEITVSIDLTKKKITIQAKDEGGKNIFDAVESPM